MMNGADRVFDPAVRLTIGFDEAFKIVRIKASATSHFETLAYADETIKAIKDPIQQQIAIKKYVSDNVDSVFQTAKDGQGGKELSDDLSEALYKKLEYDGRNIAFQRELTASVDGKKSISALPNFLQKLEDVPVLGHILKSQVLFTRVRTNIPRHVVQMVPFVSPMVSREVQHMIKQGGSQKARAIGNQIIGGTTIAAAQLLYMSGALRGGGPTNPEAQKLYQQQYVPNSLKLGGVVVDVKRGDAPGAILSIVADINDAMVGNVSGNDEAYYDALFTSILRHLNKDSSGRAHAEVLNMVFPKEDDGNLYLSQLGRMGRETLSNIYAGPETFGGSALGRTMANILDPNKRSLHGNFWNDIRSTSPWFKQYVDMNRDVTGAPLIDGSYWRSAAWFPLPVYPEKETDPLYQEMLRLKWNPSQLPKKNYSFENFNGLTEATSRGNTEVKELYTLDHTKEVNSKGQSFFDAWGQSLNETKIKMSSGSIVKDNLLGLVGEEAVTLKEALVRAMRTDAYNGRTRDYATTGNYNVPSDLEQISHLDNIVQVYRRITFEKLLVDGDFWNSTDFYEGQRARIDIDSDYSIGSKGWLDDYQEAILTPLFTKTQDNTGIVDLDKLKEE